MGGDEGKSPKVPEWLPDGWIMKVNRRNNGKLDRYFVSPVSGRTFRSRAEVMRHLNVEKADALPPVTTAGCEEDKAFVTECSEEDKPCDVERAKNSPTWLPSGWILEIRTFKNGASAGKKYKCYIDPSTGSSFYTKAAVFRHLKTGKGCNSTSKKKKPTKSEPKEKHICNSTSNKKKINADSKDNVLSLIETSPDGLPPGWIKEVRCKRNPSGVRKDPYYTDPVSGYVFRSKKDALRYIETGEISKHAFKPKTKRSVNEMHSIENEPPSPISAKTLKGQGDRGTNVKRRLFAGKVRKSNRNTRKESNELVIKDSCWPPTDRALFQCEQDGGPSHEAPSDAMFFKDKRVKAISLSNLHENELPDKPLEAAEEEALAQVIEKLLDSVSKNSPGSSGGKLSDPVTQNLQSPSGMVCLEVVGKGTLKPADKILSQSSMPVDNPEELPPKRQLEFEGAKPEMTARQKSVESVESARNIRMEPSNEKPQEIGGNKKMEVADQKSSQKIHMNPVLDEMKRVGVEPFVLANATQVGSQNGTLLVPEVKLVRGNVSEPNEMSKLARGRTSGQGIEESKKEGKNSASGSTQPRKSKTNSEKSVPITRRASKRLAGLEADPAADIEVSDKSLKRAKQSTRLKPSSAWISLDDNQEVEVEVAQLKEEPLGVQVDVELLKEEPLGERVKSEPPKLKEEPLGEQVDLEEQGVGDGTAYKGLECPMASPFGDSWPDPCIEFAFKTLTGEIPVLDTTIQGYLHEQLSSVQTPISDGPQTSVGGCPNSQDQVDTQTQLNSAGEHHSVPGTDMLPPTTGKGRVKRLCRRPITRNISASGM